MSMCSREVCDLSARLQTLTAALATHMMVESLSRPSSPVPDQKMSEPVVTALQNIVYGSSRATPTPCIPAPPPPPPPPPPRLELPDGTESGRPHSVRGLSPEPRPPTPGQLVSFPPDLPPEMCSRSASRTSRCPSRAATPQPEWQSQFVSALTTAPTRGYSPFVPASTLAGGPGGGVVSGDPMEARRRQEEAAARASVQVERAQQVQQAQQVHRSQREQEVEEAQAYGHARLMEIEEAASCAAQCNVQCNETTTEQRQSSASLYAAQEAEASLSRRVETSSSVRPVDPGPSLQPVAPSPAPAAGPLTGPIMYRATASPIHMRTFDADLVTEERVEETKMAAERTVFGADEAETTVIEKEITTTISHPSSGESTCQQQCGQQLCGSSQCGSNQCGSNQCGSNQCGSNQCGSNQCGSNQCGQQQCGQQRCGQVRQCCQQQNQCSQGQCRSRQTSCQNTQRTTCCGQQRSVCSACACGASTCSPTCCRHGPGLMTPQPFRRLVESPAPCWSCPNSEPSCRSTPCPQVAQSCRATPCQQVQQVQQVQQAPQSCRATPCQQVSQPAPPCRSTPCQQVAQQATQQPCRSTPCRSTPCPQAEQPDRLCEVPVQKNNPTPCRSATPEKPHRATPSRSSRPTGRVEKRSSPSPITRRVSEPAAPLAVRSAVSSPAPLPALSTPRPTPTPTPLPPTDEPYMPRPPSLQAPAPRPKRSVSPITAAARCVSPFLADMAVSAMRAHSPVPARDDTPPPAPRQAPSRWPPPPPPPPMPQPLYNTRNPVITEGQRRVQQHQQLQEKVQRTLAARTPEPDPGPQASAWTPPGRKQYEQQERKLSPFQAKIDFSQKSIQSLTLQQEIRQEQQRSQVLNQQIQQQKQTWQQPQQKTQPPPAKAQQQRPPQQQPAQWQRQQQQPPPQPQKQSVQSQPQPPTWQKQQQQQRQPSPQRLPQQQPQKQPQQLPQWQQHQQQQQQQQVAPQKQQAPPQQPWLQQQQQQQQQAPQWQQLQQQQYQFDWQREEEEAEELGLIPRRADQDTVVVCVSPTIAEQQGGLEERSAGRQGLQATVHPGSGRPSGQQAVLQHGPVHTSGQQDFGQQRASSSQSYESTFLSKVGRSFGYSAQTTTTSSSSSTMASALATAPLRPYEDFYVPPATMRTEPVPLPPETTPWEPPPHDGEFHPYHIPRAVSPADGAKRCVSPFLRDIAVSAIRSHSPRPGDHDHEFLDQRRREQEQHLRREEERRRHEEEERRRGEEERKRREEEERRRREDERRRREDEERRKEEEQRQRQRDEERRRREEEDRRREEESRRRREEEERRQREEEQLRQREEEERRRGEEDRRRRDEEDRRRRAEDDERQRRQEEERRRQEEERQRQEEQERRQEEEEKRRREQEQHPIDRISMKDALTIASERPYSPFVILPPLVEFTPCCMAETTPCQPIPLQTSAPSGPPQQARGPQFNPVDMPQLLRRPNEALGAFRPFPSSSSTTTSTSEGRRVSSVALCSVVEHTDIRSSSPVRKDFDVFVPRSPTPRAGLGQHPGLAQASPAARQPLPLDDRKRNPFVEKPLRSPISVPRYQQTSSSAPPPPPRTAGSPAGPGSPSQGRREQPAVGVTPSTPQAPLPQPTYVRKTPPPSPRPSGGQRTTPTPGYAVSPLAGRASVFGHHGLRAAAPAFSRERQGPASEPRRSQPGIPKQAGQHLPHKPSPLCTPPPAFTLPDPEPEDPVPQPQPQQDSRRSFQRVADSPPAVAPSPSPAQPRPSRTPSSRPCQAPARPPPPAPAPGPTNLHPGCSLPDAGGPGGAKGGAFAGASAPIRGRGILNPAAIGGTRVPLCGACNQQIRGPFITALGKIWCPHHFTCSNSKCQRPLQDIGFVEEKGMLYCEYCFEQFIAPPCDKCGHKIKGDCLNAIGKHFHPECFNCVYCGKLFGNSPFFLEDGQPYCENDWNELFTTKCFACGFPIEAGDRWVEALSNNYHSQCFNCSMCKKNLEGQSFFAKGGRPFCKNHAR